ncbi:MAG: nitrite reductase large subunit NirB, partial [Pseudomonadota bacterium]
MQKLVVIGAGMASGRFLEHLLELAPEEYDITLFGAEPRGNYNRIMLSPVLSGETTYEEIVTHDAEWYARHGITCRFGEAVTAIDRQRKVVVTATGETPYDKLMLATGSTPFVIPVPGKDLPGVLTYRDLDDVEAMIESSAKPDAKAVVIGGGLLGLEAAAGLKARGMDVSVVHLMPTLMERQLDPAAGFLLRRELENRGIGIQCKANTKEIFGDGHVEGVRLEDGTELAADIVVMAVGIRPHTALAKEAGLATGRGVHIDDAMITSDADILAVGECVEHREQCYGLVAPLFEMAKVAAQTLVGQESAYTGSVTATKLKVTGVDLFSAGDFADSDDREEIVFRDAARGVYKRLVLENNRIIGVVMYGDTADGNWFFGRLKDGDDIAEDRDTLIFGPSYAGGTPLDPMAAVAALPDDGEICGCNGICKGTVVAAIEGGAQTLQDVRQQTKASSSCGSCTGLVEQLLAFTLGDGYEKPAAKPMCGCTDLPHEDVRRLIKAQGLRTIPEVMQELGWKTSGGCHVCRPALNFYLLVEWPLDYEDDAQSRFVNERNHANIQKDGTFSVVPRMWGGITTPDELRAIADAADKYQVPMVKV